MDSEQVCSLISKLVSKIIPVYKQVSLDWAGYAEKNNFLRFNQKSVKIADIFENKNYRGVLYGYVGYLNEYVELRETFVETTPSMQTFSRVKTLNSIQDKLAEYYYWRREKNGDVSCNKCFNDLYGIRTIIDVDDVPDLSFILLN